MRGVPPGSFRRVYDALEDCAAAIEHAGCTEQTRAHEQEAAGLRSNGQATEVAGQVGRSRVDFRVIQLEGICASSP